MGPFLSVIIAAFLSTFAFDQERNPDQVDRTTATVLAIGMIVSAWVTSRVYHARAEGPLRPPVWGRPLDLGFYALLLFNSDWTIVVREATGNLPLLRQLLMLAPYVLAALARVDAAWPVTQSEDGDPGARGRAVVFHARLLLIPIAPLLLINGLHDALRRIEPVKLMLDAYPAIDFGIIAILLILATLTMPVILTWLLRTKPLAPGTLRSALEADLARQGVKIGGIEEVNTGGLVANAAYLGLALRTSRIFITDALLHMMPEAETRAVFAHEVAHGTRRHLVWFMVLFIAGLLAVYLIADIVPLTWVGALLTSLPMIACVIAFVPLSRRFEVEADLVAAETLGDGEVFNRALVRVGALAGKPLDRRGLRHFSIGARTAIVHACAGDPAVRAHWRRKLRAVKLAILGVFVLAVAGVAWKAPYDLSVSAAQQDLFVAERLRQRDDMRQDEGVATPEETATSDAIMVRHLAAARDRARQGLAHPAVRKKAAMIGVAAAVALADEALKHGEFDEARRIAADIEANWPSGHPIGDFNRQMLKVELLAIDPGRALASVRADVKATQDAIRELLTRYPRNKSSDVVEEELRFLAAASGVEGATLEYEPQSFESSRLLALLSRGTPLGESELSDAERALAAWPKDNQWRRTVLERKLGGAPRDVLNGMVAETRRGA